MSCGLGCGWGVGEGLGEVFEGPEEEVAGEEFGACGGIAGDAPGVGAAEAAGEVVGGEDDGEFVVEGEGVEVGSFGLAVGEVPEFTVVDFFDGGGLGDEGGEEGVLGHEGDELVVGPDAFDEGGDRGVEGFAAAGGVDEEESAAAGEFAERGNFGVGPIAVGGAGEVGDGVWRIGGERELGEAGESTEQEEEECEEECAGHDGGPRGRECGCG